MQIQVLVLRSYNVNRFAFGVKCSLPKSGLSVGRDKAVIFERKSQETASSLYRRACDETGDL